MLAETNPICRRTIAGYKEGLEEGQVAYTRLNTETLEVLGSELVFNGGIGDGRLQISSGNGMHLYWILDEPFKLDGADAILEFEHMLKGLADVLHGDRRLPWRC